MPSSSNPLCSVCYKPTSDWCSRCQQVWYCSADHLKSDWPRHRNVCRPAPIATFAMQQTPNSMVTVDAIYFPVKEEKPYVISIQCSPSPNLASGPCPVPFFDNAFFKCHFSSLTLTQGLNQEPLRFPLQVWYDNAALSRKDPVNRAVSRITSGQAIRPWCGHVVVLKFSGSRQQAYSPATLNDLPALSAYFLGFK